MFKKLYAVFLIIFMEIMPVPAVANSPGERVTITTDRDVYIAGEWVYFSIQLSDQRENSSDFVYLTLGSNNQRQIFTGCLKLNANTAYGSIYLSDTLTTSVYQLVSYTNSMRNYGSDVFAVKNILVSNRFDNHVKEIPSVSGPPTAGSASRADLIENTIKPQVTLNKDVFSQREQVKLDIRLPEELANALLSVSVRIAAPVTFPETRTRKVTIPPANSCDYLPERSGIIMQGMIKDENNKPVAAKKVFLSCVDSIANLQFTNSDNQGEFRFFLNPYYFGKNIFIKADGENRSFVQIEPKYFDGIIGSLSVRFGGDIESFLESCQKYLGIQRSYDQIYRVEHISSDIVKCWRPEVYTEVEEVVKPADYIYLPNFREISQEILLFYKIREKNDDFEGSMLDINKKVYVTPYIFLDGVLLEHVRQIMFLDSKKIRSITTIPNARLLGNLNIPGIMDITTISSEIEKVQWQSPIEISKVENPLPNSAYKVPDINRIPRNIPAYLPLLYWDPAVQISSGKTVSASFYTSDCTGTFEVVIKGLSSDGNEMECKKLFDVVSIKNR